MRKIFATGIFLAGLGYLLWLALAAPEIEFLRPAWRGEWIVHPGAPIRSDSPPVCPDMIFEKLIVVTNLPSRMDVTVTAMRGFRMYINTEFSVASQSVACWKRNIRLDLRPYLRVGQNVVRIVVSGRYGPPALLVEGAPEVRTGPTWRASYESTQPFRVVIAGKGEWFRQTINGALTRYPWQKKNGWLLAAYAVFILYALVPMRIRPWLSAPAASPVNIGSAQIISWTAGWLYRTFPNFIWRHGLCLAMLLIVAIVQFRNVTVYPYNRSPFDADGHVEYIRLAADKARIPMASEGWEMFQPPAYYFTSALVYRLWGGREAEPGSLKAVQVFSTICGLLNLMFALGLLWMLFPDQPLARNLGFASIAFLPVHFYMNPAISNEVFASAVISGTLLIACWAMASARPPWIRILSMALACGIAMLSKYTGIFLILTIGSWLGLRALANRRDLRAWGILFAFAAAVLLVSGWYYHRNVEAYGNPFIGNWDYASGQHFEQMPGYRTSGFYARFGSVLFRVPENSRWASFWDGQYGTFWADAHGAFLDPRDAKTEAPAAAIVWLALLPTVAFLLGFFMAIVRLFRGKWDDPLLALVLLTFITFISAIAKTMIVPTYSATKGSYLLSLLPAIAVFSGMGFTKMARHLGQLKWIMYASMAALAFLVLYVYRFDLLLWIAPAATPR